MQNPDDNLQQFLNMYLLIHSLDSTV